MYGESSSGRQTWKQGTHLGNCHSNLSERWQLLWAARRLSGNWMRWELCKERRFWGGAYVWDLHYTSSNGEHRIDSCMWAWSSGWGWRWNVGVEAIYGWYLKLSD
jgi:hypothetical protein